jgi:lysophospholipase L1-like esterase
MLYSIIFSNFVAETIKYKMKNFLPRTFLLTLIVVAILLGLYYLPPITFSGSIGSWFGWSPSSNNGGSLRQVDLLGDLRDKKATEAQQIDTKLLKSLENKEAEKEAAADSAFHDTVKAPAEMIKIVDYGDNTLMGMAPFYEALNHVKQRPVRIAFLGDSFVEGDILTGDLRAMLQQHFGGCGVGWMDITSQTAGFRQTVTHTYNNWDSYSYQDRHKFSRKLQGIDKRYYQPRFGAWVDGKCSHYAFGNDHCANTSLFFIAKNGANLNLQINQNDTFNFHADASPDLQMLTHKGPIKRARWNVDKANGAYFYGMAMDGSNGIILDNFSMRGNSGTQLSNIPDEWLAKFNQERPYDLIVIQFGLNVVTKMREDYNFYKKDMMRVIEHLHKAFPQAGILVISVGDRAYRADDGEMSPMPGAKNLSIYQQSLAADAKVAFWNLHDAMLAQGGMAEMVKAKPSLANLDYTHINFRGGKVMAQKLYEALLFGKGQYDRRKAFTLKKRNE